MVDPVAQPNEYQALLLRYLGERDPAAVQARTPDVLEALVKEAGDRLRTPPAPEEWSVIELLGHVHDAEIVMAGRYRWTIAHDEPPLMGYDQDLWVERLRHADDDPQALLEVFAALRSANIDLWRRATPEGRRRFGMHAERGPESIELSFRMVAGHDLFHIEQIERTLSAVADA